MPVLTVSRAGPQLFSGSVVASTGALPLFLGALNSTAAPLTGAEVALWVNEAVGVTPRTLFGDFTLPTPVGLAAQAITWSGVAIDDDLYGALVGESLTFTIANAGEATLVYGALITNAAGDAWYVAESFPDGIDLSDANDRLIYIPVVPLRLA